MVSPVESTTIDLRPRSSPTSCSTGGRCLISSSTRRDKIALSSIFAYCYGSRLRAIWQGTRPTDGKRRRHLGKSQLLAVPFESRGRIFCGLLPLFLLERRIRCSALEEVPESPIQVTQGLLWGNTGDFIQPGVIFLLLQLGQLRRSFMIANAFLVLIVGISTQTQCPLIQVTSTAKGVSKNTLLLGCWVEPILVCSFLFHISHCSIYDVKHQQERRGGVSSLPLKGKVSTPQFG
jgi:hypothetical protein